MTKHMQRAMLGAAMIGACAALPHGAVAQQAAQAVAQSSGGALEEIVVTARRREENIQSVPIAVNAFSEETIREKAIISAVQLQALTPAYTLNNFQGRESALTPHLRGLPGVRTYFAEAPLGFAGLGAFYDLQNVQVLVGPQGTLFGLNAVGGAILREPKRPTNKFEGYVQGTYGSYNQREIEGAVNIPIVDDKVLFRAALDRQVRDGFTKRLGSDEKWDDRDYWAYRAAITVKPWDGIENYLVFDRRTSDTNASSYFMKASNPTAFASLIFGHQNLLNNIAQQEALGRFTVTGATFPDQFYRSDSNIVVDIFTAELTDSFTFKNVASRSMTRDVSNYDEDGSALQILDLYSPDRRYGPAQVTWTEEPQLQLSLFDRLMTGTVGAFVQYVETPHPSERCVGYANFGALPNCSTPDNKSRTQSLFGQATFDLGRVSESLDGLKFTAGYRRNWDHISQTIQQINRLTRACTNAAADVNCRRQQNGKWKAPSWTFALDYQILPQTLVYATTRRAYTSGFLNDASLPDSIRVVKPQYNTDLELGVKSDWTLGELRGRSNVALYRNWFTNIQELSTAIFTDAQGVTRSTGVTRNAAKAIIEGVDVQLQVNPTEWVEFNLAYNYMMAKYKSFLTFNAITLAPVDLSTRGFAFAPKHAGNATVKFNLPIDPAMGKASVAATYMYMKGFSATPDGAPLIDATRKQLDLRADWNDVAGYPIDIGLFALNVTQSKYTVASFNSYAVLGLTLWTYTEPRALGAQVRYRFGT